VPPTAPKKYYGTYDEDPDRQKTNIIDAFSMEAKANTFQLQKHNHSKSRATTFKERMHQK
jgi:hypothetical protein